MTGMELYFTENGVYPESFDEISINIPITKTNNEGDINSGKFNYAINGALAQSRLNITKLPNREYWFNFYFKNSTDTGGRGKIICRATTQNAVCASMGGTFIGLNDGDSNYSWELK